MAQNCNILNTKKATKVAFFVFTLMSLWFSNNGRRHGVWRGELQLQWQ